MTNTDVRTALTSRQCCKRIYGGGRTFRGSPCSKKATVKVEGNWYCTIHDPVRIEAKRAAKDAVWDAKHAEQTKRWKLEKAAPKLLDALKELRAAFTCGEKMSDEDWNAFAESKIDAADKAIAEATGAVGDRESDATPQTVA